VAWSKLGAINAINDALLSGNLDFAAGRICAGRIANCNE
jgi:hypothetical protein